LSVEFWLSAQSCESEILGPSGNLKVLTGKIGDAVELMQEKLTGGQETI